MSNFFGDIAKTFGLIGDYFQQSAERGKQIVESKKPIQTVQPTIQPTQPKVGDVSIGGFFGDIAQKFNLKVPNLVPSYKPTTINQPVPSVPSTFGRPANLGDVGNLVNQMVTQPVLSGLKSIAVGLGSNSPLATKPINLGFNNVPIIAKDVLTDYTDRINAGQNDKQAFWGSTLDLVGDLSILVPMAFDVAKVGILKWNPEKFLTKTEFNTQEVRRWIGANEPLPKDLQNAFKILPQDMKVRVAKGIVTKISNPKPSIIGKIFGITEEDAKILYNNVVTEMNKLPTTKVREAFQLPGTRPVPGQAPAFGLSLQEVERVGGAKIIPTVTERLLSPPSLKNIVLTTENIVPITKKTIDFYKQSGVSPNGIVQPKDASTLIQLNELSDFKQVKEFTKEQVNSTIAKKEIHINKDGTITVWRVGNPIGENRLVSVTYVKDYANEFVKLFGERPINEYKIKPEDVKIFVGGGEKELLIQNPKIAQISPKIAPELEKEVRFYIKKEVPITRDTININDIRGRGLKTGEIPSGAEDLTKPVIVAKQNDGTYQLLDGRHRLSVLEKQGAKNIDAIIGDKSLEPFVEEVKTIEQTVSDIYQREFGFIKQESRLELSNTIRKLGGIRISGGIKEEIIENVPIHLLNKNGQSLDEMAQELHGSGFPNIVDSDSLMAELNNVYANKVEPIIHKDPVRKTKEFEAIPDDMKSRIVTFFRPSRKLESRVFNLLGNKDTTIPLLRNTFNEWVKSGTETIIEPYGGAFTVGTHGLNDAIKSGLKNFYSNIFDKEKYTIIKAVQDGRLAEVKKAIDDTIKRFSDTVYKYSEGNTKVRKVLDDFFKEYPNANIGSREFYSFIRKQPIGSQVTVYQDDYEAWSSVFNRAYKDLFVKDPEGLRDATMTAFLKRIEQRQGEIVTHSGFTSYYNKIYGDVGMITGLEDTMKTFQLAKEYGTKIHLYNEDGSRFIKTINAKSLGVNPEKVGYYFDPPYVKSASIYDQVQELDNFSSGYQLATSHENAFLEAKQGARMLLTNDVETEYIAEMEKRLKSPGLFAYREGVTPTSLIVDKNTTPVIDEYLSHAEKTAGEREEIARLKAMQIEKSLSTATFAHIRKNLGIENLKKATDEKLSQFLTFIEGLQPGDKLLTDLQIESAKDLIKEGDFINPINLVTQREFIEKFGEQIEVMGEGIMGRVLNELVPSVDIKEGHPLVKKIVNKSDELLVKAEQEVERRDKNFSDMITRAEKSRKLPVGEKVKRFVVPQNKEIFQAMSGAKVELTKEEVTVVAYLKNFFNKVKEDLKLEKYRQHYITHLEKPLMEKILSEGMFKSVIDIFKLKKKETIPLNIMLELDNIIGSEKFFRFALERKGGITPTTNIRRIVHSYSSLYETKKALDQILPEGQVVVQLLLKPKTAVWTKKFLQNLKGRGLDTNFRIGKMAWLPRLADNIVDIGYLKLLGLNYWSALKNLVAGEANSFITQDFKKYLIGKSRLVSHPRKTVKIAREYGILEGTFADYAQRGIGKLKKLQDLAMIGQRGGEYEIRSSLFASELTDEEWQLGKISPERVREIKDLIAITQGVFSKTDSPLWLQTWYGRLFLQMNRWRITNVMLLRRLTIETLREQKQGKRFGSATRNLSTAFILYGIGMYLYYELGKAGYKKAAQVAQTMGQEIHTIVELVTLKPIVDALTDNPTLSVLKEMAFTIQELANYIRVPGIDKPTGLEFQRGIEKTWIAPIERTKELLGAEETGGVGVGMPSLKMPSLKMPSLKMPSLKQ